MLSSVLQECKDFFGTLGIIRRPFDISRTLAFDFVLVNKS